MGKAITKISPGSPIAKAKDSKAVLTPDYDEKITEVKNFKLVKLIGSNGNTDQLHTCLKIQISRI